MRNLKKLSFLFLAPMVFSCNGRAAVTNENNIKFVKSFIDSVEKNDRQGLANNTEYPLGRGDSGVFINNKDDFIKNYDILFDTDFVKKISESNLDHDWDETEWQGIFFDDGSIWLNDEGKLVSVNHKTVAEKTYMDNLAKNDRQNVNESLRNFLSNKMVLKTKKYLIRIDAIDKTNFRYAAWSVDKDMSSKPDIIVTGGQQIFDGSAGNNYYEFKNDNTKYVVYVNVVGSADRPYDIEIYKDNKIIETDSAQRIQ
jgi:hypothetical protein